MDRFYSKIVKTDECWIWTAATIRGGYGQFMFDGRLRPAHVVSYILHISEVPEGVQVLHTCDNPLCVNPNHLFLGTQQDNMTDKVMKGRQAIGEQVGTSKLTEEDVFLIRQLLEQGQCTQVALAKKFSVDPKLITQIKYRRIWRHI